MNLFDVLGPVMIGPSSSHTAGVVRIGNICNNILGHIPKSITIEFFGSFAKTYKGHGSDKAIIGGLLGFSSSDPRIRDSLKIAKEYQVDYEFIASEKPCSHPNTIKITALDINQEIIVITAISIGGGNILISKINDLKVNIDGKFNTLLITHTDLPGVVMQVAKVLYENKINIASMNVHRSEKRGLAMMLIETDECPSKIMSETIAKLENVKNTKIIECV